MLSDECFRIHGTQVGCPSTTHRESGAKTMNGATLGAMYMRSAIECGSR